jgi:prolyl-tRNA editing enzyme YbaK/EbsC (Cys-tRNA(Pro) deacylase)
MADVTGLLEEAGVDFDVLEHAHTERAADEAAVLGIAPQEVAKTLVLVAPSAWGAQTRFGSGGESRRRARLRSE